MEVTKKVFLGGTCNESTWRDELIPQLNIDYFNPVVDDWTADCMQEEIKQRRECSLLLYVITPEMTGVYSIAEAVQDSNKRPSSTIFCVLSEVKIKAGRRQDGFNFIKNLAFDEGQWLSLMQVQSLLKNNGAKICHSLPEIANYLNEGIS